MFAGIQTQVVCINWEINSCRFWLRDCVSQQVSQNHLRKHLCSALLFDPQEAADAAFKEQQLCSLCTLPLWTCAFLTASPEKPFDTGDSNLLPHLLLLKVEQPREYWKIKYFTVFLLLLLFLIWFSLIQEKSMCFKTAFSSNEALTLLFFTCWKRFLTGNTEQHR